MSSERSIETTGESVEEAISKGLAELGGVSPTDVIVEVLEEPSRGMFGLGARPARVRLQLFRTPAAATAIGPVVAAIKRSAIILTSTTNYSRATRAGADSRSPKSCNCPPA